MNTKRFILTTVMAWLIFIGIDFLFHASILEKLWAEEHAAFKPALELAILIPVGYLSFLFLVLLVGYPFTRIFPKKPTKKKALSYGLIIGLLFSIGNILAYYSFIAIPLKHLILFNIVYFIEIIAVVYVFYILLYAEKTRRLIVLGIVDFFVLIIIGVVIQNIF